MRCLLSCPWAAWVGRPWVTRQACQRKNSSAVSSQGNNVTCMLCVFTKTWLAVGVVLTISASDANSRLTGVGFESRHGGTWGSVHHHLASLVRILIYLALSNRAFHGWMDVSLSWGVEVLVQLNGDFVESLASYGVANSLEIAAWRRSSITRSRVKRHVIRCCASQFKNLKFSLTSPVTFF